MTSPAHVTNRISDYLLGLLSSSENRQVEAHIHHCAHCRHALTEERQIRLAVRQTLHIVSRPEPGQLDRLRPDPPRRTFFGLTALWPRGQQIAVAALLLVLIITGAWSLVPGKQKPGITNQQVVTSIAVTATRIPTSTTAPTKSANEPAADPSPAYEAAIPSANTAEVSWALLPAPALQPPLSKTPLPAGTPVAALPVNN
jgi:anti-sigma factor RsiW